MAASILKFSNRDLYFPKAITQPQFGNRTVLANDEFQYVELWLKRNNQKDALFYWNQSKSFFQASKLLPSTSSPLTAYYCMMNAVKALLTVKAVSYADYHGVSGDNVLSRRSLENEISEIQNAGVLAALSKHLGEIEPNKSHSLHDILGNLPFIHRAFSLTHKDKSELFISIKNPMYMRHPIQNKVWWSAEVIGRDADRRVLRTLPPGFEIDEGVKDRVVIRRKSRVSWFPKQNATAQEKASSISRLQEYHRKLRCDVVPISAQSDLWYLKRRIAGTPSIQRYGVTLMMAAMHRLSELARYDPKGLSKHLSGSSNWLLTEFIELSPAQFIADIACEITGLEFRLAGVRR